MKLAKQIALPAVILWSFAASATAGWNPLKKPLEPAQRAAEAAAKIVVTEKQAKDAVVQQPLPQPARNAAEASIDGLAAEAQEAIKQRQTAEEDLAIKKNMFVLTVVGLVATNLLALGGFFPGRRKTKLEIEKLKLEIEEKKLLVNRARQEARSFQT